MSARAFTLLCCLAVASCDAPPRTSTVQAAAQPATPVSKPRLIAGQLPVAQFVAEQLTATGMAHTLVYVGASWCEPCVRFHRALEQGTLDVELPGVRFIEYDFDHQGPALSAAGYSSRLLPLFALPEPAGTCSDRRIEGSVKGPAGVENITSRLRTLLALDKREER